MQQHGNTAVRQHGNAAMQQHGNAAMRQHGNTAMRQHRNAAMRQHGNRATWQQDSESGTGEDSKEGHFQALTGYPLKRAGGYEKNEEKTIDCGGRFIGMQYAGRMRLGRQGVFPGQ